jgi:hypothetical protein
MIPHAGTPVTSSRLPQELYTLKLDGLQFDANFHDKYLIMDCELAST